MKLFLIVTLFVYSVNADKYISSDLQPLTDEIVKQINAFNTTWKAGKNFKGSSSVRMDDLVARRKDFDYNKDIPVASHSGDFPFNFDARKAWSKCPSIGKIYDQRKGYPSWIYTAVGTIADRLCIKHGVRIDVEATVENMVKSNVGSNSYNNSANIGQALKYWAKNGIFTVELVEPMCLPFSQKCQPNEIKLNRYFKVTNKRLENEIAMMRSIALYGPIPASMEIDSDLLSYKSGIYKRLSEKHLGYHNIKIIGFGIEKGVHYFLVANSWGTEWGEKGFFKYQRRINLLGDVPNPISLSLKPVDIIPDIPKSYVHSQLFYLAK